jgi:hypothetical protein
MTEAARGFNVPRSTLRDRAAGHQFRSTKRANNHKMTEIDEETLTQWILTMNARGSTPRQAMVQDMADLLLAARGTERLVNVGFQTSLNVHLRFNRNSNAGITTRGHSKRTPKC